MSEKKLRRRCVECHQVFDVMASKGNEYLFYTVGHRRDGIAPENAVLWQADPFDEEIYGNLTKKWLCLCCAYGRYMDT